MASILVAVFTVHDSHVQSQRGHEQAWRFALGNQTQFPGAILDGLDLRGLYAPGVDLSGSSLSTVILKEATLNNSRFDGSDLTGADFDRARLESASFRNANLTRASFIGADLASVDMRGAVIGGTDLTNADLYMADVRGVDLSSATLTSESIALVCSDGETKWPQGIAPRATLCDVKEKPAAQAASWTASAYVTQYDSAGKTTRQLSEVSDTDRRIRLLVRFKNTGRVPLSAVNVIVKLEQGNGVRWRASRVVLFNGNYPQGYEYPENWLQDAGETVNVNIGNYNQGLAGEAFLTLDVAPTRSSKSLCGDYELGTDVYASPAGLGAVRVSTSTLWHVRDNCR